MKPKIGIIPGDPSGIGPELVARLLNHSELRERADILLIGDHCVFELGIQQSGCNFELARVDADTFSWAPASTNIAAYRWLETETIAPEAIEVATTNKASGRSVLATLNLALDLMDKNRVIDAIAFAPFNKAAMHMAGLQHADELHHMGEWLAADGYLAELNTLDGLWTSRVTSHIALRDVADTISEDRVCAAIKLIDATLKRSGIEQPHIAVAALNPHAGDNGNFGREEIDVITPAVKKMAREHVKVDGPWPADTIFLRAKSDAVDAIVSMYHDQGQIALKLMGFDRGVSVQGGLPYPVTTPAHGTAFDIAGQGKANVGAMLAAFNVACNMAASG